jgi:ferritin-like metal-binding protein YciE
MASKDPIEALNSYVTDMLALEQHIKKAIDGQIEDLKNYPAVTSELRSINGTIEGHISTLEGLAKTKGGKGPADLLKQAGSAVLGLGAAAVDLVRNEGLPKNLRDDYTACSLATIGYVMLHTTALSLGDRQVGDIAHRHLSDYARIVMNLHNIIPAATIKFLQEDGLPASDSALPEIARNIEEVWHQGSSVGNATQANLGKSWQ